MTLVELLLDALTTAHDNTQGEPMTTDRPDIAGGYRASAPDHDERRARRKAGAWRHDPEAERLLALKDTNPARWDQLPSSVRLQLGYYAEAKTAAETVTDPKDAA